MWCRILYEVFHFKKVQRYRKKYYKTNQTTNFHCYNKCSLATKLSIQKSVFIRKNSHLPYFNGDFKLQFFIFVHDRLYVVIYFLSNFYQF